MEIKNELRNHLGSVNWLKDLREKDTEESWKLIKDIVNSGIDIFITKILWRRGNNQ